MALSDDGDGPELQSVPSFDALFVTEYPKMVALAAAVSGSRLHACANPPMPIHPDLQGMRQLSIQPTGIDSCLRWFTVDLFLDDAGDVAGITLDVYEP